MRTVFRVLAVLELVTFAAFITGVFLTRDCIAELHGFESCASSIYFGMTVLAALYALAAVGGVAFAVSLIRLPRGFRDVRFDRELALSVATICGPLVGLMLASMAFERF